MLTFYTTSGEYRKCIYLFYIVIICVNCGTLNFDTSGSCLPRTKRRLRTCIGVITMRNFN